MNTPSQPNQPNLPDPQGDEATCRTLIDSLMAYLDGELDARQAAALRQHLAICPSCVNYAASYRSMVDATITALCDRADAPGEIPAELVNSIFSHLNRGDGTGGHTH